MNFTLAEEARMDSARTLLETRLRTLEAQADLVLDTLDPERAERILADAVISD